MKSSVLGFTALLFVLSVSLAYAQSNAHWEQSAVRLDLLKLQKPVGSGTGFFYWDYQSADTGRSSVILVTCKHVLTGADSMTVSCLVEEEGNSDPNFETFAFKLTSSQGERLWVCHSDSTVDVAAMRLALMPQHHHSSKLLNHIVTVSAVCSKGDFLPGDDLLYVGFPDWPHLQQVPIVRKGTVALLQNPGLGKLQILVEAFALPGNSGSPVFATPKLEMHDNKGEQYLTQGATCLVGLVSAFDPEIQYYYDQQGHRAVALPWHSGLSRVFTADAIRETVALLPK